MVSPEIKEYMRLSDIGEKLIRNMYKGGSLAMSGIVDNVAYYLSKNKVNKEDINGIIIHLQLLAFEAGRVSKVSKTTKEFYNKTK